VSNAQWSPDGKTLAFLFLPLGKEVKVDKQGKAETPVFRHIKEIWYRLDGQGYFDSENTHVWLANAKTGATKQLVKGDYDDMSPCWSPDSKEIVFLSLREKDWRLRSEEQDIFRVSVGNSRMKKVSAPSGPKFGGLSYSPTSNTKAYLGHDKPYQDGWGVKNFILHTISKTGKNHREHGRALDRTSEMVTVGDITPSFTTTPPIWNPEGSRIYYGVANEGRQHPRHIQL
jgi:dipeptidyl aminopeptidase/acylaminoacyl peptidase